MKRICIFRRGRPSALPPHPPAGRRDRPGKPLPEKDGKNDNRQFFENSVHSVQKVKPICGRLRYLPNELFLSILLVEKKFHLK